MLYLTLVLVVVAVYIEVKTVTSIPKLRNLLERFNLASLIFSLALSAILGAIFGAAGVIVFVAAMVSTMVIQPWYRLRQSTKLLEVKEVIHYRYTQLCVIAQVIWTVIYLPFKGLFAILDFITFVCKLIQNRGIEKS